MSEDRALDYLEEQTQQRPDDARAWLRLADRYALREQAEQALASYDRALALDPTLAGALAGHEAMKRLVAATERPASAEVPVEEDEEVRKALEALETDDDSGCLLRAGYFFALLALLLFVAGSLVEAPIRISETLHNVIT